MATLITAPRAQVDAAFAKLPRLDGSTALWYHATEGDRPERIDEEPLLAMLDSDDPIVRDVDAIETPDGAVVTADGIFGNQERWIETVRGATNHRILALSLNRVKATAYPRVDENDIFVAVTFPRSDLERCMQDATDGLRTTIQGVLRFDGRATTAQPSNRDWRKSQWPGK